MELTTAERCRTPCGATVKQLSRSTRFRNASGSIPGPVWPQEKLSELRQRSTNYAGDFASDHEIKSPGLKSSDESEVDTNIAEINYPEHYDPGATKLKSKTKTRDLKPPASQDLSYKKIGKEQVPGASTVPYSMANRQYLRPEVGHRNATIAEQRLLRLKDLQRKRELMERYYSQEIRKLVSEYYARGPADNSGDSLKRKEESGPEQRLCTIGETVSKALEPCGTMTTITRLDCGCMQETTRPIFTTLSGRVENRNCRHGPGSALLRIAPPNPREHLQSFSNTETCGRLESPRLCRPRIDQRIMFGTCRTASDPKRHLLQDSKSRNDSGVRQNRSQLDSQLVKTVSHRPGTVSSSFIRNSVEPRSLSPLRKYSDTSTD